MYFRYLQGIVLKTTPREFITYDNSSMAWIMIHSVNTYGVSSVWQAPL